MIIIFVTDKASHPMIHGQKEVTSLPVAAVEEEVRDIPLSALDDGDGRQTGTGCSGLNLGHLEYEITSDDGFTCRSDSLDGRILFTKTLMICSLSR